MESNKNIKSQRESSTNITSIIDALYADLDLNEQKYTSMSSFIAQHKKDLKEGETLVILKEGEPLKYIKEDKDSEVYMISEDKSFESSKELDINEEFDFYQVQYDDELFVSVGSYKKLDISEINEDKESSNIYYLLNLPEITEEVRFYREKTIEQNQESYAPQVYSEKDELDAFRTFNSVQHKYILLKVDNETQKCTIRQISANDSKLDVVLNLFTNDDSEKEITEPMFQYLTAQNNLILMSEKPEAVDTKLREACKETVKVFESQVSEVLTEEDKTISDFLEEIQLPENMRSASNISDSWSFEFYNTMRDLYGKYPKSYSEDSASVENKNNSIYHTILTNQMGLSDEEADQTLCDIMNYYNSITNKCIEQSYFDKTFKYEPSTNQNFTDIYTYFKRFETELKAERAAKIKLAEEDDLDSLDKIKTDILTERNNFERDALLGNIKFPKEYQALIISKFESLKIDHQDSIMLDIIRNTDSLDVTVSRELKELRAFSKYLDRTETSDKMKTYLLYQKYKSFTDDKGENIVMSKNEHYINKYISGRLTPIEIKMENVFNLANPTKENPSTTIYSTNKMSLVKEYAEIANTSGTMIPTQTYKVITTLKSGKTMETVLANNGDTLLAVSEAKRIFKRDEDFYAQIEKDYNNFFQLRPVEIIGKETKEGSYTSYVSANLEDLFNSEKSIITANSQEEFVCYRINPEITTQIGDTQELIIDKITFSGYKDEETGKMSYSRMTVEEKTTSVEDLQQIINDLNTSKNEIESITTIDKTDIENVVKLFNESKLDEIYIDKPSEITEEDKLKIKEFDENPDFLKVQEKVMKNIELSQKSLDIEKRGTVHEVQKNKVAASMMYKDTRVELIDALKDGKTIMLNNFNGNSTTDNIKFLRKTPDGAIQCLQISKRNTKLFDYFYSSEQKDVEKDFSIKTSLISGEKLGQILDNDTGKNTSSLIINSDNLVDTFWNSTSNTFIGRTNDSLNEAGLINLNNYIQQSVGKFEKLDIFLDNDNDAEFKFFEDSLGNKNLLMVEKEDGLYKIQLVKDFVEEFGGQVSEDQTSISIKGLKFENGKFIITDDTIIDNDKFNNSRNGVTQTDEIKQIRGLELSLLEKHIAGLNTSLEINKISMDSIDNSIKGQYSKDTARNLFRILSMDSDVKYDIINNCTDILNDGPQTFLQELYERKDTNGQNLLITFLEADAKISRNVEIDSDAELNALKIVNEIKTISEENPDLEFSEIMEMYTEKRGISPDDSNFAEVIDTTMTRLGTKLKEETAFLSISSEPNFDTYIAQLKNPIDTESNLTFFDTVDSCFSGYIGLQSIERKVEHYDASNIDMTPEEMKSLIRFYTCSKISALEIDENASKDDNEFINACKEYIEEVSGRISPANVSELMQKIETSSLTHDDLYTIENVSKNVSDSEDISKALSKLFEEKSQKSNGVETSTMMNDTLKIETTIKVTEVEDKIDKINSVESSKLSTSELETLTACLKSLEFKEPVVENNGPGLND